MTIEEVENISIPKQESVFLLLVKIGLHVILGTLCFARYPAVVNIAALGSIVLVFLHTLNQKDYGSFFLQILFCNHFVFGSDNGGLYNIAGLLALISYYLIYDRPALTNTSVFGRLGFTLFAVLCASEVIALTANYRMGLSAKMFALGVFILMIATMYNLSKVKIKYADYSRFIYVLFFFTCYHLVVAMNQRLYLTDLPFFPTGDQNAEFELGLVRSGGVFLNYEAYGEYSLSLIALLLPGVLSGRLKAKDTMLFLMSLCIIVLSLFAIVLSGTRSSLLLLPLVFLFIVFSLGRRLRVGYLVGFFALAVTAFFVNLKYEFVDINIFLERSASMDFEHMSLKDLLSGSEMNRGDIFDYAFKKLDESKGLLPAGYYTKEEHYVVAHFDRMNYLPTDYHNLYLSSIVLWGIWGAIALLLFFFISVYQGIKVYSKMRYVDDYTLDLLLGFNAFFLFFLINEYKIQFIRSANYFVLIFLFLILYRSLIRNVSNKFWVTDRE